ncbi:MAG TPA: alpha/beta hydrolase [Lysobacter sp.]
MSYQPRRPARHGTLRIRGLDHRVMRWGPDSDASMLLLHGWGDSADSFQFIADEIMPQLPLAAFDWRGFGHSDWNPGGYWFPDYYADLDELLDRLCPAGPAYLVGHSMGGNIAMSYAGIRPARVRGVVNLEGFGLPRIESSQAPVRIATWLDQLRMQPQPGDYAGVGDLAERLMRRNPRLLPARAFFIADRWTRPLPDGGVRLRADPAHRLVSPYLYRREEAEACWRQIAAPVLMVFGEQSDLAARFGTEGGEQAFRAFIPGLRVEVLAGAGHMLHHEAPAAVARLIEAFLGES